MQRIYKSTNISGKKHKQFYMGKRNGNWGEKRKHKQNNSIDFEVVKGHVEIYGEEEWQREENGWRLESLGWFNEALNMVKYDTIFIDRKRKIAKQKNI